MRIRFAILPVVVLALGSLLAACGGDGETGGDGLPACPDTGTDLTYANFGQQFFADYCTSCHAEGSGVAGAETSPFTSQAAIQDEAAEIFERAGGTNTNMPQSGSPAPTADERNQLAEWLSCGAK